MRNELHRHNLNSQSDNPMASASWKMSIFKVLKIWISEVLVNLGLLLGLISDIFAALPRKIKILSGAKHSPSSLSPEAPEGQNPRF